ncbi:unnamed protein product [Acanthoscelides obtectus]|uniref:Uncharacterized protein n=1 Tax=Acanthoscelides obtectus TaxID=200917 RepID=A0A9P0LQL2_ACAOB|nr:unnamed protein product [Acanthoscelides obtectus]CAK1681720.1 hypothetical protein AOBTE_LOCUS33243 [Acanthoscelides obtectus]
MFLPFRVMLKKPQKKISKTGDFRAMRWLFWIFLKID